MTDERLTEREGISDASGPRPTGDTRRGPSRSVSRGEPRLTERAAGDFPADSDSVGPRVGSVRSFSRSVSRYETNPREREDEEKARRHLEAVDPWGYPEDLPAEVVDTILGWR